MKKKILTYPVLCLFIFVIGCCGNKEEVFINFNDDHIEYMGRIGMNNAEAAELYWSGTSIKLNFEGTYAKAILKDETGDNYYNIILDNEVIDILRPDTIKKEYTLVSQIEEGRHSIEIFKRNEWDRGKTWFYGFNVDSKTKILPVEEKKRKIEFYGNSITAGYAIEDYSGNDSPDSTYTNNYLSYAALSARYFNAEYYCICKGGIGIMISWFHSIMPLIYDRIDPTNPESKWDFSEYTPDVVVINLLQNDSWLVKMPDHEEFKSTFGTVAPNEEFIINAYRQFVENIRKKYPNAHIICMLGNMDITREESPWPGYVEKAVKSMGDDKIYTHFVPYKDTPGHPKVEEHKVMAESLIGFIEENIEW